VVEGGAEVGEVGSWPSTSRKRDRFRSWGTWSAARMSSRRHSEGLRCNSAGVSLKWAWRRAMVKRTMRHRRSTGKSSRAGGAKGLEELLAVATQLFTG
jgi:hypothetical protein